MWNEIKLSYKDKIFSLEMKESGEGRDKRAVYLKELKKIQMFVDTSSIEIFINNGEEVFTSRFYPKNKNIQVEVFNKGTCTCYDLNKFKIEKE